MIIHPGFIGIDVSKAHLDIFDAEHGRAERLPNCAQTARALAERLGARPRGFAVFEATGEYDRHLRDAFDAADTAYARVNPQQARDFARATGRRAKNDRLDAQMLAAMGQALQLPPTRPRPPARQQLAVLHKRRDQLVDQRAIERTRLADADDRHGSLKSHLAWLDEEIVRFDRLIADAIAADAGLAEDVRLLRSVPGIGPVTATTLIALMPELGAISPGAAALLAGIAPLDNDTGQSRGIRHIGGGRRRVRRALYMAAITGSRSKSRFGQLYRQLRAKGKPAKVAIIAVARKLIVILNAIIRDRVAFQQ